MHSDLNPYSPASVKQFLRERDIHPSRRLGQSFLIDRGTASRIVEAGDIGSGDACLEIGAGLGALTVVLAEKASRVIAVEVDGRLAEALESLLASTDTVEICHSDFLRVDLPRLLEGIGRPVRVVANIPYSITSPIIERLLEHKGQIVSIALLVQKEFAERVVADPGTRHYSSFSLFCRYHARASVAFSVSRRLFVPSPEVDSALLLLTPRPSLLPWEQEQRFFGIVRAAFAQRRKTIVNSLSSGLSLGKSDLEDALKAAGIDLSARAEDLGLADYVRLLESVQIPARACSD